MEKGMFRRRSNSIGLRKFRQRISIKLNRLHLTAAIKKAELKKATECCRQGIQYHFPK